MGKYAHFKGMLRSKDYDEVMALLAEIGITYIDVGFGFDKFYFDEGLYRLTSDTAYLIYGFNMYRPVKCECLSFRDCHPKFRPVL